MKYLENLNDKQREAAMYTDGALLILAGAGSGKTSTMTRRIAYLVDEKGVSPYNILAVTFTNKAAREMEERVEEILGSNSRMWIMTFHAACLRMLRMDGDRLGYTNSFVYLSLPLVKADICVLCPLFHILPNVSDIVPKLPKLKSKKRKQKNKLSYVICANSYSYSLSHIPENDNRALLCVLICTFSCYDN